MLSMSPLFLKLLFAFFTLCPSSGNKSIGVFSFILSKGRIGTLPIFRFIKVIMNNEDMSQPYILTQQ
jgi:hypothetical protein